MTRDFMYASMPPKSSPGYRPGEQEAIAAFRSAFADDKAKVIICPGFGSGVALDIAAGPQAQKNDQLVAEGRTNRRRNLEQERKKHELVARILEEYAKDSAPRCYERIAAKVGSTASTVGAHLRAAGLTGQQTRNWG